MFIGNSAVVNNENQDSYFTTKQNHSSELNYISCRSCSGRNAANMTFLKRCFLIVFFLQIGCLALDHSTTELSYEEDEIRLIVGNNYPPESVQLRDSEDEEGEQPSGNSMIAFHPTFYDFKECPVGMPRLGLVRVDNRLKEENVKLISISGNTVNFHSSFFADKVIGPGNATTFEVVFLSREEGRFDSTLYIHTSKGLFKYHVRGVGLPNPYRLRPLVGARIPVNASYEPMITLHNPHETPIVVVEMLSSGTDFSLKLPREVDEKEGAAWAIEPFQTKPVMQGSFQGKVEGNHTGFIKIKVNHTDVAGEYLMVPVEVQVSSSPGIYSPQDSLDFGLLVRSDKPKTLSLSLINAQTSPVNVQSVAVKGDPNSAVRIEFRPVAIEPDASASTVVALITFDPSQMNSLPQSNGYIEVKSDCGKAISIPFQATVLEGELEYNASSLGFFVKSENIPPRNFSVRNNFSSPVAIYQVSVNHPDIVQVDNLNQSHVITPGEQKTIFTLKVQKKAELCDSKSAVQLTVKSNVTCLKLPITCYDGKLHLHSAEQGQVDFGRVELYSTFTEYFSVENKNPIEIRLKSWGSNSSWSQVELVGMQKGVKEDLAKIRDFDSLKKSLFLQPGHMAVFSIDIRRPTVEGMFFGESYVTTDHNQTLRVPFRFAVSKGSVHCDTIFFDKSFPGKISYEKLHLSSTFNHTLNLLSLRAYPTSSVSFSSSTSQDYPEIPPHRKSFVGKVHFDPRIFCRQACYSGFTADSQLGKEWAKGAVFKWETGDIDLRILDALQNRYQTVQDSTVSNISLWVDTNGPSGFKVKAQVRYIWPRLSSSKVVVFPLTALGNETCIEIPIYNPSDLPIIVQVAMSKQYGPSWVNFIQGDPTVGGNTTEGALVFSVSDVSPASHSNRSVIFGEAQKKLVEDILGVNDTLSGISFLLPPNAKYSLSLKFKPISKDMASSLLLLRNNLTGIETVWLKGRAGTGQLTVGNGTPGSSLLFQLTEKLLQGCEGEAASKYVPPQLTVRRSFVARNVGEIPLDIVSLEIFPPQGTLWSYTVGSSATSQDVCEGYGFRILNCHPFTLQPNQTHSVDIAFTPDFTLSKVVRSLRLTDSTGGHFNYSLVALIPSGMLSICASVIARPTWEPCFKYVLAIGAVVCIIVAALMSYFEAGTVVSQTVFATVRVLPKESGPDCSKEEKEKTQKLDLKAVYDKVENRFKRSQQESQRLSATATTSTGGKSQKPSENNSTVSNGNLRNRKTKKGSSEMNTSQNTGNKNVDKSHQNHISKSGSHLSSTDDISDSGAVVNTYSNLSNSTNKKEKENIGFTNNGKKKKNNSQNQMQQQNQSSKPKQLKNKNENFNASSFNDKNKGKTEEETSSTTTESSNPDDFIVPEKERKTSVKGTNNEAKTKTSKKDKNDRKKESDSTDNVTDTTEIGKVSDEEKGKMNNKKNESVSNINNKSFGNVSPKQETSLWDTPRPPSGDDLSELAAQTEAFVMQRPSRRNNSGGDQMGNGMINGNMNAGSNISNSQQMSQNIHQMQMHQQQSRLKKPGVIGQPRSSQTLSNNHLQQQQQSSCNSLSHPMSPTTLASSYSGFPISTKYMNPPPGMSAMAANTGIRTSPSGRPMSNSSNPGSIWGSDILPDNGCDIWDRRSLDSSSSTYMNNRSEHGHPRVSNPAFGSNPQTYAASQNGYPSSGIPKNISQESRYPPRVSPNSKVANSASTSNLINGNAASAIPTSGTDSSYLFGGGGITNEILSNLWHINTNTAYGENPQQQQYRNQPPPGNFSLNQPPPPQAQHQQQQSQFGLPPPGNPQHGYLQRMRSDPTIRSNQRSASNGKHWSETAYTGDSGLLHRANHNINRTHIDTMSESMRTDSLPPIWLPPPITTTTSSMDSQFSEWRAVAQPTTTRLTEPQDNIWMKDSDREKTKTISNKWPTTFGPTPTHSNMTDSLVIGSGSRPPIPVIPRPDDGGNTASGVGSLGDMGLRGRTTDMTQNLREVEAGLGFNPFTSDIWNQSSSSSDNPSWNNNYRYSANE